MDYCMLMLILHRFSIVPIINWLKCKYIYCRPRSDCVFGRPGQSKGWSLNTVISVSNETGRWWFGQWVDFASGSSFSMGRVCCQQGLIITWWQLAVQGSTPSPLRSCIPLHWDLMNDILTLAIKLLTTWYIIWTTIRSWALKVSSHLVQVGGG